MNPGKFFGGAETFLFELEPRPGNYKWVGTDVAVDKTEEIKAIAQNASMFMMGTPKLLVVGGGGLHFGLSIDETLETGTSGTCLTFNNLPLGCADSGTPQQEHHFEIRNVEVWSLALA